MAERVEKIRPPTRRQRASRRYGWAAGAIVMLALAASGVSDQAVPSETTTPPIELFMMFGRTPVWMGDRIRYTVYEHTRVEARISGISGELLLLLDIGEQEPGQHTLPWDGTTHGSPFAGRYEFELFFGDEYAAQFWFLCRPLQTSP